MKHCTRCNKAKSPDEFSLSKLGKDGRCSICKECRRSENRERARNQRKFTLKLREADPEHYLTPLLRKWQREEQTQLRVCATCREEKSLVEFEGRGKGRTKPQSNCRTCLNKYHREYYQKHPDKRRDITFRSTYKQDRSVYDALALEQGGRCAICVTETKLHTDHDHQTNIIRGLLCRKCNRGLGMFNDNPEFLQSAISYLFRTQFKIAA